MKTAVSTRTRRWLRFSLRGLLLLMLAACVIGGWKVNTARQQQGAVSALLKLQATVHYQHEPAPVPLAALENYPPPYAPRWLRRLVGDDYFRTAVSVTFPVMDQATLRRAAPHLRQLPYLKEVRLSSGSCHSVMAEFKAARAMLLQQLPAVKVTGVGPEFPYPPEVGFVFEAPH